MLSPLLLHPLPPDQLITPQNRSSSEPSDSIAISPHLISLLRSHVLLLHSSLSLSPIYPPLPHSSYFFFLCRCPFFLPPSLILYGCLSLSLSVFLYPNAIPSPNPNPPLGSLFNVCLCEYRRSQQLSVWFEAALALPRLHQIHHNLEFRSDNGSFKSYCRT